MKKKDIEKKISEMEDKMDALCKKLYSFERNLNLTSRRLLKSYEKNTEITTESHKFISKLDKFMQEVVKTNSCIDETCCNILLAIRQNEYLQAWYPKAEGEI